MRMLDLMGNWVTLMGNSNWNAVTLSDDGKTLLAAAGAAFAGSDPGALFSASIATAITAVSASSGNSAGSEGATNLVDGRSDTKYLPHAA